MNKRLENRLLEAKRKANKIKDRLTEARGTRKHLLNELKTKYGLSSRQEVGQELKRLKALYEKEMSNLEEKLNEINETFSDYDNKKIGIIKK